MVAPRGWLIDKSAHVRLALSPDAASWAERIAHGLVRISPVTVLELGFSARNAADWRSQRWGVPVTRMPLQGLDPRSEERAIEVQGLLAERGHHRAPGPPDLLIAATAERAGLTLLHVDHDFDLIADITGQPVERLSGDF